MKAQLSLAVLVLIGAVSASSHHHQRHAHSFVQSKLQGRDHGSHQPYKQKAGYYYKPTRKGAAWFDLDDPTERIEGTDPSDFLTAHDAEVVDAPEDMPRVGNTHHSLHNAKLSPNGYYTGFFHKDYKGNYVQQRRLPMSHNFIQLEDHLNDTDDIVTDLPIDSDFVMINDHELDTDDIPDGLDPNSAVMTRDQDGGWVTYMDAANVEVKKSQDNQKWDEMYAQEEEDQSYEFVQTKFDHENDTDDIPEGQDPVMVQFDHENDTDDIPEGQDPVMTQLRFDHENDTDDIPEGQDPIMLQIQFGGRRIGELVQMEDEEDDISDVVLMRYTVGHHENDTDDIAIELNPDEFDNHHSRMWNMQVQHAQAALEKQMEIEENMEKAKERAKEEAKLKAAQAKAEQERQKLAAEEAKKHPVLVQKPKGPTTKNPTVDLAEMYAGVELDAADKAYMI